MKWTIAVVAGATGSLLTLITMKSLMVLNLAPFNTLPAAVFVARFGLPALPLGVLLHFAYGALACTLFVARFGSGAGLKKGLAFAGVLWLVSMLVYSPAMGWGLFGVDAHGSSLSPEHLQHLTPGPTYPVTSLALHAIYGAAIGLLPGWLCRIARRQYAEIDGIGAHG